jgi:coatomer subunit beta'
MREKALAVATDLEHRFDLAVALGKLDIAYAIAQTQDSEEKWRALGDSALQHWDFALAKECLSRAKDYDALLLLYQASGDAAGMQAVAVESGGCVACVDPPWHGA